MKSVLIVVLALACAAVGSEAVKPSHQLITRYPGGPPVPNCPFPEPGGSCK